MNLLGVGPFELLLVLIIATIVLGPERMAEAGRVLGRYYALYRNRWQKDVDEMTRELRRELAMLQQELDQVRQVAEGEIKAAQSVLDDVASIDIAAEALPAASAEPVAEPPDAADEHSILGEPGHSIEPQTNEVEQ
jgi:sec-independent protein translocase protein TatB